MKDESVILEAEVVEKTTMPNTFGNPFSRANRIEAAPTGFDAENRGSALPEFLRPTFGNLFLLGCLVGLFFLYCCSCIIHALTFPARRKSS